jgi:hypothetical protein
MRIRAAKKHTDSIADPDPQHCVRSYRISKMRRAGFAWLVFFICINCPVQVETNHVTFMLDSASGTLKRDGSSNALNPYNENFFLRFW